jgi:serine protease AprX
MARRTRPSKGRSRTVRGPQRKRKAGTTPRAAKSDRSVRAPKKSRSASKTNKKTAARRPRRGRYVLEMAPGLEQLIKSSATLSKTAKGLGENVMFTVAPKTVSDEPIQAQRGRLHGRNIDDFRPRRESTDGAIERLTQLGFEIVHRGRFGITVRGPAKLVSDVLKTRLAVQAQPRSTALRGTQNFAVSYQPPAAQDLYIAPTESLTVKSTVSDDIDHFVFIPPPLYFAPPSPTEPGHGYFGIDKVAIRRLLNVPTDASGAGVRVAIIDTGFFRHPYYAANTLDYRPTPTPSAPDPESDSVGHGTAIAYNTFAVAPDATVMGFQQTEQLAQVAQVALEEAADRGADIISCSWGWQNEQTFPTLEATIRDLVREGKIVLFASGNNGMQAWPGSMPDVLSIGGVYANNQNELEASNFASGFMSNHYAGRRVPDVCGLCGEKPKGVYIMMPCPPNCDLDNRLAGSPGSRFPDSDETRQDDGWISTSGTSAATPQIAGVVALMVARARAKGQTLTTDSVRDLLQQTAVPVQKGSNALGIPAVGHPNTAVGFGLVDADAALARI